MRHWSSGKGSSLSARLGHALILGAIVLSPQAHAQADVSTVVPIPWWLRVFQSSAEHLGALLIAAIAVILAYIELKAHRRAAEKNLELEERRLRAEEAARERLASLEERKFRLEEAEREKLVGFREQELRRFSQPATEIAEHIARLLVEHPDWAHRALDAARLLPYTHTLFGERSQHFREEKQELAVRFVPYLLKRCEMLTSHGRHVFLLMDAGTTLYPFFELIGTETMKCCHRGDDWLQRFHLATNSLPGIEQLIKTGRRAPWDRYSSLAIEDCHLLPGIPVPIFAAVAGKETNDAVRRLRETHLPKEGDKQVTFIALVVGNWVRIRRTEPRCPVPMARGDSHREVKQTFVDNADEIFVVSPLGKIFVGHSKDEINTALGFNPGASVARDPDKAPYDDVIIDNECARRVKLVSTTRAEGRLLHRHSCRVEDTLMVGDRPPVVSPEVFAAAKLRDVPHLVFPFASLPTQRFEEFMMEFPHYHTRANRRVLEMFGVDPSLI